MSAIGSVTSSMPATTIRTTLLGLPASLGNRILVWHVNDVMHTACRLLDKQGMHNANPAQTPLPASIKLLPATPDDKLADIKEYQSIVGSLQYLACVSRPDIAYAASTLGSFNAKPSVVHLNVAKHVLRYLKHSAKLGITYSRCDSSSLTGYTDANYFHSGADSVNIGYVFKIAGGAVAWRSKKVKSAIPQSTAEAELYALNAGVCELQWICDLLEQLHIDMPKPTLLCDNQAVVILARSGSLTEDNTHYHCKLHLPQNLFQQGMFELEHVPSTSLAADYLTKSLGPSLIEMCLRLCGCN